MASTESTTAPRFDVLHELLTRAEALGVSVQLSVHNVPTETLLDWLQLGLLDAIERGASSNPPTGTMEAGEHLTGRTAAVVFMEGERERARRIERQEDAAVSALREELEGAQS